MPWTLYQTSENTKNQDYRNRVYQGFLKTANDVANEDINTPKHAVRLLLANQVLWGSGVPARCYELLPVLNAALQVTVNNPQLDPTDNDLLFTISSYWDTFAEA